MTGRPIGKDTITVLHAPLKDDGHRNQRPDWANATSTPVPGCNVQPGASIEYLLGRDETLVAFTVLAPISTAVAAEDRVIYQGTTYEVYGAPARWPSLSGRLDYTVLYLQNWKG